MHRCFCNLVIAGATSLKCKNKQLKLIVKRRKVNLGCARWSIFTLNNRLKINAEVVLQHLHLKNFLRRPTLLGYWYANVQSPDFWLKRLGRSAVKYFYRKSSITLHKKWIFPFKIFSVCVTKSTGKCGLVTFTEEILSGKLTSFFFFLQSHRWVEGS